MKGAEKIFDIYSRPGKWFYLKFAIAWIVLAISRLKYFLLGKNIFFPEETLESPKELSSHEKAFDAVFFQGVSQDGFYLCGGTERRHEAKVNGLFYIIIPELGMLMSKKLPNTVLRADQESLLKGNAFAAEGIYFKCIRPMKEWHVSFKGEMRYQNSNKTVDVKLEANWYSDLPWFLFGVEMPIASIAEAIAREPWTSQLFKSLKEAHQTHYEQMGKLKGFLTVGNKEYKLKMDSFRDHSFGFKRDWTLMHRYIFHMFYLENGMKICIGVVSQPCTTSNIEMGYVCYPNKKVYPITNCDLKLYQHGEHGVLPDNLCFVFEANEEVFEAIVKYEYEAVHFLGNNIEAKMHERFITCEVNGVRGRGISEWHYNNTSF